MAGEIFISYRRADQAKARLLHALLKQRGVDAWYDALVGAGEDWRQKTAHALEQAQIFVLLFSKVASESDDISKELAAATFSKKLVIPVRIENIKPSGAFLYELASRNWIDAHEDTEARFAELADKLAALVKGGADAQVAAFSLGATEPPPAMPKPVAKAPWFKRPAVLAGAAAMAVAVIAGAVFLIRGPSSQAAVTGASPAGNVRIAFFGYTSGDDAAAKQAAAVATEEGYRSLSSARLDAVNRVDIEHSGDGSTLDRAAKLGARFLLEGSITREGDKLRTTAVLVDVPTRTTIAQGSATPKVDDPRYAGTSSSVIAATFANCVVAYVGNSGITAPDPATLTLFGDVCTRSNAVQNAPLRDIIKRYPDSALAHARLASSITYAMLNVPAAQRPALLAEADAALARAEALAPNAYSTIEARISVAIAHDRPPLDWLPQAEADLARPPLAHEAYFYAIAKGTVGATLLQVGRATDAALYVQAAYELDPNTTQHRYYLPLTRVAAGQYGAKEGFEEALSRRVNSYYWEVTLVSAIFMDALDPEAVIKRAPEDITTFVPCYRDLAASLKAKDAKTRLAGAKRADGCLMKYDSPHVDMMAQANLGNFDRAFALADRPDLTQLFWNYFPTLFLPPNRAMRADPRFLPLMQKLGYVDYWKQSKTQPDICATPEERDIPLCMALR
ncbi:MAG: TIR domain-containing protein [Hyphomonadaceae bacterium]